MDDKAMERGDKAEMPDPSLKKIAERELASEDRKGKIAQIKGLLRHRKGLQNQVEDVDAVILRLENGEDVPYREVNDALVYPANGGSINSTGASKPTSYSR